MARFDMSGLDAVVREMQARGEETGPVADAMLLKGAAEVRDAWRLAAGECGHRATGAMIESIGFPRGPEKIGEFRRIDIYPQGTDERGVRNAYKAFLLHYGTSRIDGSHWVDLADRYCEVSVVPAMEAVWTAYLETGRVPAAAMGAGPAAAGAGIIKRTT